MVIDEDPRMLRKLAKEYQIFQKSQSDEWPSEHESTFQKIQTLSLATFQAYGNDTPWRGLNKGRVEWLVDETNRLATNGANEWQWRMRIENRMIERFFTEVACPDCFNRLWRSEIETTNEGLGRMWAEMEQRRSRREPCKCLHPPQNPYAIGTSKLFEDRVEEIVVHQDAFREPPKQKPDRIIGLRETNNIQRLLNQSPRFHADEDTRKIRDILRCSPFKWQSSPLLLPFLVLEAKSDSAQHSFSDIQNQSALPIQSLLNIQKELQSSVPSDKPRPQPLVWLLGYKGSDWKLYGCYIGADSDSGHTYNLHHLQSGDLTTKDGALQLILIVDHIVDWARDVFRESIIAQLTSLATGKDLDDLSLRSDSNIKSKTRTIQEWISQAPSTLARSENSLIGAEDHGGFTRIKQPNTQYGAVRPLLTSIWKTAGLRLTEGNVDSLLKLIDHPERETPFSPCARKLLNEITRWDEVLVVIGADLDYVERVWTDESTTSMEPFDEGDGTQFYAVFEYRCFMNIEWQIIREFSYLAISKSAFSLLVRRAAFSRPNPRIKSFPKCSRDCSGEPFTQAVDCIRSGSAWQVFHSAISSTLLSLYPEPERKREDCFPAVESIGLGYRRTIRVRCFIENYLNTSTPKLRRRPAGMFFIPKKKARIDASGERDYNRSFERIFQREIQGFGPPHNRHQCVRCESSNQDLFSLENWEQTSIPSPTEYNAVLVTSLKEPGASYRREEFHDSSLFVFGSSPNLCTTESISTVVEVLAQNGVLYHTIRHEPLNNEAERWREIWNLPSPYRMSTRIQQMDVLRWASELVEESASRPDISDETMTLWEHQQMLLQFLRGRMPFEDALAAVEIYHEGRRRRSRLRPHRPRKDDPGEVEFARLDEFLYDVYPHEPDSPGNTVFPDPLRLRKD